MPDDGRSAAADPGSRPAPPRTLVVYGLQPGVVNYGVERMALATLNGLQPEYRTLLLAPDGDTHARAAALGMDSATAAGPIGFARRFSRLLWREPQLVFITGSVEQSLVAAALNVAFRRRLAHIHVAHGGPEPVGYARKRWMNWIPAQIIAVSDYVRRRLIAHGVRGQRIVVVDNFLEYERAQALSQIAHPSPRKLERVLSIIKLEPWKRPHLILDAIDARPELQAISFTVLGEGDLLEELRERAAARYPNVRFVGYAEADEELRGADLLLHPNPEEPFGLVVIEAMFAGVPVLVPDGGGAGDLVTDGVTGYRFTADDATSLAERLVALASAPGDELEATAQRARAQAAEKYDPRRQLGSYRAHFEPLLARSQKANARGESRS